MKKYGWMEAEQAAFQGLRIRVSINGHAYVLDQNNEVIGYVTRRSLEWLEMPVRSEKITLDETALDEFCDPYCFATESQCCCKGSLHQKCLEVEEQLIKQLEEEAKEEAEEARREKELRASLCKPIVTSILPSIAHIICCASMEHIGEYFPIEG